MKHLRACAAVALALALLGTAACGDGDSGDDGGPYSAPTEETPTDGGTAEGAASLATETDDAHGEFLVDNDGMALYLFTTDNGGESTCYDACATTWPPLLTNTEEVTAGGAVDASLIGTTERDDGKMQVTYNGWPLYYYAEDKEPGQTEGQGVQNVWYLVAPSGDANTTDN
jgi:predicted lipoprotein with Yx(FWY)xxD motif